MKRVLSLILSLVMVFSVITSMDISAFAATDDFSLNKYLAQISLRGNYEPYKNLQTVYLTYHSGCEKLVDASKETHLEEGIAAWYTVKSIANPGNSLEALNYQQQYEALLYSVIFDVLESEELAEFNHDNTISQVAEFTNNIVNAFGSTDILDKKQLSSDEKILVKNSVNNVISKHGSAWSNLGEYSSMVYDISIQVESILNIVNDVAGVANRMATLMQLMDVGDSVISFLYDIKNNTDDPDLAMATQTVINNLSGDWFAMVCESVIAVGFSFGKVATERFVNLVWNYVCDTVPFCLGMVIGDVVGTAASNALFATSDTIEQYSNMKKFVEVMGAARSAFSSAETECKNNINDETAAKWIFACDFMYSLLVSDYKCSVKYFEIVSTKGIVNKVKSIFGGDGYQKYANYCEFVNGELEIYKSKHENFIATGWSTHLKTDYPAVYNTYLGVQNYTFKKPVTSVTSVRFPVSKFEFAMNQKEWIRAIAYPATTADLTYSSSNENVFVVDPSGRVLPKGEGTATLIATALNGVKGTCKITVYPYNVSENKTGYSIAGYTGSNSNLSFPTEINGVEITAIGENAFFDCDYIESVTFHEGIKRIENQAFQDCDSIVLVTIPEHLVFLGERSFFSCDNLEKVIYNAKNCEVELPVFTTSLSPFGKSDKLTSVEIGSSVEVLPEKIFHRCLNLSSISIPDSVTRIGGDILNGTAYYNDENNWENHVLYNNNHLIKAKPTIDKKYIIKNGTKTIAGMAFKACEKLEEVIIPDSVIGIGAEAFANTALTTVTIPNSVTRLNGGVFLNCESLESVKLHDGIKIMEISVFSGCSNLKSFTFPKDIVEIYPSLFQNCTKLESVVLPSGLTYISMFAFSNCTNLKYIFYPGTEREWSEVQVSTDGAIIENAVIHYNSTDHTYSTPWELISPTCTEDGSQSNTCVVCNDIISYPVQATGHNFSDEWTIDKEPTCAETGSKSHHCFNCDEKRDITEIDVLPHSYGDWIISKEATCTTNGNKYKLCSDCGIRYGESIPAIGHTYSSEWTIDASATCSENGSKSHHCINCGDRKDVTGIPATGHVYSGEWSIDVIPTCSEIGSKSHHCINCGDRIDVTVIPATGHNYSTEWIIDVEPTCTFAGSKSHHCLNCGEKNDVTTIPANGHSFGAWVMSLAPTCTKSGFKIRTCSVCSKAERENLSALGHDYSGGWVIDVPASCTKSGSKSYHCANCGVKENVTVIEAIGHNYILLNSMEDHPHTNTYKCSFCEDTKTENSFIQGCEECSFTISPVDDSSYKVDAYVGTATDVVIPAVYNGLPITKIEANCFKGNATIKSVVIPEGVTAFGNAVFYGCSNLESVIIPGTLTSIGNATFYGCESLKNVTMSEGVTTIGNSVFRGCTDLENLIIPASVTSIGASAFNGCSGLEYIYFTGSESEWSRITIGSDNTALSDLPIHYNATEHTFVERIIKEATCTEDGLKSEECSVCGCSVETEVIDAIGHNYSDEWIIDVPSTCTEDGSKSHHCANCGDKKDVTAITSTGHSYEYESTDDNHPHTITYKCIFCDDVKTETGSSTECVQCNFEFALINDSSYKLVSYIGTATDVIIPTVYNGLPVTKIEANCFKGNTTIESVVIPEGITSMGNAVFYGCTSLETVTIPSTVTNIGNATFYSCENLKNVTIEEGVTSIGNSAFRGCTKLESVIIPKSVTIIGVSAFNGCSGLKYIFYTGSETDWDGVTLGNDNAVVENAIIHYNATDHQYEKKVAVQVTCTEDGLVHLECITCGVKEKSEIIPAKGHKYSTEWTIDVEATCTTDGSKSHHCTGCGDKADITVIESTGHNYVFDSYIENHPHTDIYICSFCNDEKKESSYIGDCVECNFTVSAIDENSYKLDSYIGKEKDVVIPSTYNGLPVTKIEANCFKGNTTIKSVVIPEGVTNMGNAVFYGCTNLESVVIPGSLTSTGNATFYNCASLSSVTISDGVTSIGNSAFRGCSALESIIIPESVTTIGTQAFNGFVGTIYCTYDSAAHKYAVANNIKFIIMSVFEKDSTQIDYENNIIKTNIASCSDISDVLELSKTAEVVVEASHKYGNSEFYGTGTIVSVFENDVYVCDFTLIVEGDTNGDSVCDVLDCAQVERVSNGNAELTGVYAIAGDSNSDSLIDINDYQAIVNKAVS